MNRTQVPAIFHSRTARLVAATLVAGTTLLTVTHIVRADEPMTAAQYNANPAALIEAYRHVEAASVSDALQQLYHEALHVAKMQAISPPNSPAPPSPSSSSKRNNDPNALAGMLQAIDSGGPGSVYVMTVEEAQNRRHGGLMGTAMFSRGFSGAIVEAACAISLNSKRSASPSTPPAPYPPPRSATTASAA